MTYMTDTIVSVLVFGHNSWVGLDACQNASLYCEGEATPLEMSALG